MLVAFTYTTGVNWLKDKPVMEQNLKEHMQYMQYLSEQEVLVVAGALDQAVPRKYGENVAVGLFVVQTPTIDKARNYIEKDPLIVGGTCQLQEIHGWQPPINNWTGENFLPAIGKHLSEKQ